MKKRPLFAITTATAMIASTVMPAAYAANFKDTANHPYEEAINNLANSNILSGYQDGTFQPNRVLTRSDVVKLLGKYLVTIGYTVPTNYKSSLRFTDLATHRDDELLRYAAVVKDAGVFLGSNGQLLPAQLMKREHMALVLVRAFTTIRKFDYVQYASKQTFLEEYLDEDFLTTENAAALRVFDFFDIVVDDYYRPKDSATRGEFASALYQMLNLQPIVEQAPVVEHIDVISDTRIIVTMSTGEKHHIRLDTILEENVPTNVSFSINNVRHSATVTYVVEALQIDDVYNLNGAQFMITFNQPVDLATVYNQMDLEKMFILRRDKYTNVVPLIRGELSPDRRSLKITTNVTTPFAADNYRLTVRGTIHALNGTSLLDYESLFSFKKDTTGPVVERTEYIGNNRVRVYFTEPIEHRNYQALFETKTKQRVIGITSTYSSGLAMLELDLTNARVQGGASITDTQPIQMTFSNLKDIAGNQAGYVVLELTKKKADGVRATITSIEQLGAKMMKVVFSEPMQLMRAFDFHVMSNGESNYVENVERVQGDDAAFILTMDDYLEGRTTVQTRPTYVMYDLSGQETVVSKSVDFTYNPGQPNIIYTEVTREQNNEYLYIHFDNNVSVGNNATISMEGSYTLGGQKYFVTKPQTASVYADPKNPAALRVMLSELLAGIDRENTQFTVNANFTGVTNEYRIPLAQNIPLTFTRGKDYNYNYNELQVVSVETSRTNANIKTSNMIVVNFNYNVDQQTAEDLLNYELSSFNIVSAKVNPANYKQVILTTDAVISYPTELMLSIDNIRAQNAITRMESYYGEVYLNETIRPYLTSATGSMPDGKTVLSSSVVTSLTELTLTFSEAIEALPADSFIITTSTGSTIGATASISNINASQVVLKLDTALRRGQTVTIALKSNYTVKDLYGNESTFRIGTLTVPY